VRYPHYTTASPCLLLSRAGICHDFVDLTLPEVNATSFTSYQVHHCIFLYTTNFFTFCFDMQHATDNVSCEYCKGMPVTETKTCRAAWRVLKQK
jgi:hypothetical protein